MIDITYNYEYLSLCVYIYMYTSKSGRGRKVMCSKVKVNGVCVRVRVCKMGHMRTSSFNKTFFHLSDFLKTLSGFYILF